MALHPELQRLAYISRTRAFPLSSCSKSRRDEQRCGRSTSITGRVRNQLLRQGDQWMLSYLLSRRFQPLPTEKTGAGRSSPSHRYSSDSSYSSAEYTLIWNTLDYPACVFPVTEVDPVLDQPKPAHLFLSNVDQMVYELCTGYCLS
jgi:hypothetical protein